MCNIDSFHPGSSDGYVNLQNKPGFCFECGYMCDPKTQNVAEEGILHFLAYYGCVNDKVSAPKVNPELIRIINLYKNNYGSFKSKRYFRDFEKMKEKTLIGFDGDREVYIDKDKIVLFVRDRENTCEECFLVAESFST